MEDGSVINDLSFEPIENSIGVRQLDANMSVMHKESGLCHYIWARGFPNSESQVSQTHLDSEETFSMIPKARAWCFYLLSEETLEGWVCSDQTQEAL